ncbi:MAG: hypothetical protein JNL01_10200 [Bdellovibrionales bacterium]|nr:hypothetical protein [Bdellovibrionales bacterium]
MPKKCRTPATNSTLHLGSASTDKSSMAWDSHHLRLAVTSWVILQASTAFAGYQRKINEVSCVHAESFESTFEYWNHTRGPVFLVPHHRKTETCKVTTLPTQAVKPGHVAIVRLRCIVRPSSAKLYFSYPFVMQTRFIDPVTQEEHGALETLHVRGFVSPTVCTDASRILEDRDPPLKTPRSDCNEFRLDLPPLPLSKVAVRSQGNTNGTCYAAASTGLYDYMRAAEGQNTEDPASTLAAAFDFKKYLDRDVKPGPKIMDGGSFFMLLDHLALEGACPHSEVTKKLKLSGLSEDDFNYVYSNFTDDLGMKNVQDLRKDLPSYKAKIPNELDPNGFIQRIDSVAQVNPELLRKSPVELYEKALPLTCLDSKRQKLKSSWQFHHYSRSNSQLPLSTLQQHLERSFFKSKNNHPVAVGMRACAISDDLPTAVDELERFLESDSCGGHALLLIGQKWNAEKNRCEVILRNSYGTGTCRYYSNWDCDRSLGTVSMDKEIFLRALKAISTIERRSNPNQAH